MKMWMHIFLGQKNWIDTYVFPEGVKVIKFCLTLVGEARLWYESLKPIALDWNGLQTQFRFKFSKIRNTRKGSVQGS